MLQDKYIDNNEKYNKYRIYNYCRNYINDIKNKYMGFSNTYKNNSPNRYYYESRRNNNYYRYNNNNYNAYNNNTNNNSSNNNGYKLLRHKRYRSYRSYRSLSNSKHKTRFVKKYKNYDEEENIREYKNWKKRSYSSMKRIYDKNQRHHNKVYIESGYNNEDHKNKYVKNYNLSRKKNYYSYKKRIYSGRRNYDTHFGQGNIFYNNEYYLFNDGATLKKKKIYHGRSSFRSKLQSQEMYVDRIYNKRRYFSRNNRYTVNNNTIRSRAETSYKDKNRLGKSQIHRNSITTHDDGSRKSDGNYERKEFEEDEEEEGELEELEGTERERGGAVVGGGNNERGCRHIGYKDKINRSSGVSFNNKFHRNKKRGHFSNRRSRGYSGNSSRRSSIRGKGSSMSLRRDSYYTYSQRKRQHIDKYSDSYKKTISRESSDIYCRRKNVNKRNRTKVSYTEDIKKKKKKKKENNDSDDEIVHFSWKKGMILNECYIVIRKMGDGTFGRVLLCQHLDTKKYYAVKVIRNIKKYTKSAKIEADILKKIQNDDIKNNNIVKYHGKFMYYDHMCLIFEPLGPSLYEIITKNNYNGFHIEDIKLYCIEILKALNYLRKLSLTHTDLKPENILLDDPYFEKTLTTVRRVTDGRKVQIYRTKSTGIKLIDFGCATFKSDYHGSIINTRQYRAPEVILNLGWDVSSDMWSFGCVLAELYTGSLLFRTHEHLEHLAMMESIIHPIPKKMLYEAAKTNGSKYINKDQLRLAWPENASSINSVKHVKRCLPLYKIIKHDLFCDFLYNILQIDPALRSSPSELLKHKFLEQNYEYF
ncbi:protein serine/threonine kinase-1 [Plasmodium brasilianum]|uniref:Serine/threonine kinase-1, putative n=2 Tax=Plasmodium (Plasmodium) TaxID=418103 RepID=A0A1A8WAW2_PLAMA|nr:protein serine/threonine kinase-1, putative [Plasmodium malariae]KAI4836819.1 protein serine/threonine kinase-1 [Plasmodium brasilianum]SBS88867.1 serine/threonine kinase-1, putative [Plasmodium malariae]SCO94118.1 protein serine/threonine kinase-1, putative [Plasmodium malariae]